MRKCGAESWSNLGRLRNLDCAKPSAWKVTFKDDTVSGYPCDDHVAHFLNWDDESTVAVYKDEGEN